MHLSLNQVKYQININLISYCDDLIIFSPLA
jgi:hypothetical protein